MPKIKQPHTSPISIDDNSLEGCTITFVNSQTAGITSNHPELADKDFNQLKQDIAECSGAYTGTVASSTHLVATQEQYKKNGAKIERATKAGIYIVSYDWLVDNLYYDGHADEGNYLLTTPTIDDDIDDDDGAFQPIPPATQPQTKDAKAKRQQVDSNEEDPAPKKLKSDVLDSMKPSTKSNRKVPVDDSYMQERKKPETNDKSCQVYQSQGIIYDATLNQTDSKNNANKFYRIQLLEYGNGNYRTWTRWGRVGESGQCKLLGDGDLQSAISEFENKFKDKTRNDWDDRDKFTAKAGKYTLIEINYESSEAEEEAMPGAGGRRQSKESVVSSASSFIESKLPKAVASLMAFIFDQDYFNESLKALNYDPSKMPLGKLSKKTLLDGYAVLKHLAGLVGTPGSDAQLTVLSDQYFSLIPHAFGRNRPPVLSNSDMIKREAEMLENLTDMQLTNEIMKSAKGKDKAEKLALADRQFQGLGLQEMTALEPTSTEYKELASYLVTSAGGTHQIRYNIQNIFRVERAEDTERFENSQFSKLGEAKSDRALLWHGSRSTNFGGILSQGLRIAPPEAPVSGYMFGKGVYLANMSTKSANYCCHYDSGNQGLLLLCEAELGKPPLKLMIADSNAGDRAKAENCISTWGVGTTRPYGWKDAGCVHPSLQGVRIPDVGMLFGPSNQAGAYLQYDEFICYDIAQVRLRYLIRTGM